MLYFVATPIGNMGDISYRGVETLKSVDLILCEDTRHSIKLLDYYGIKKPLEAYHKFNEVEKAEEVISYLEEGKNIALITDAGTPVVSDPGGVLTKVLTENNIEYTVVPGPSAFIPALILSGLDAGRFSFIGFLPEKKKDRVNLISEYKSLKSTLIFHVAPQDIKGDVEDLYSVLGNRKAALVKEITKIHETIIHFNLASGVDVDLRGEFILVVEGATETEDPYSIMSVEEHVDLYVKRGMSKKDAIKKVSELRGLPKKDLYNSLMKK